MIAEELGFVGVAVVIGLFAWLLLRAYAIGRQAARLERPFAALVAHGIGIWIGVQTFINIGVNMGVLPTKGLTLPLLSFGGSGIVANCVAIAILLRVDYENRGCCEGSRYDGFAATAPPRRIQPEVSVKANAREARVKAANAAGRNQNRRLLRGFTV